MRYTDTTQRHGRAHEDVIDRRWSAAHPERRKDVFLASKHCPKKKGSVGENQREWNPLCDLGDIWLKLTAYPKYAPSPL